jgi:hypothetical protein
MIPTSILVGLVIGLLPRSWARIGAGAAALAWPVLLVSSGAIRANDTESLLGAFLLAAVNTVAGVVTTRTVVRLVRAVGILLRG